MHRVPLLHLIQGSLNISNVPTEVYITVGGSFGDYPSQITRREQISPLLTR